MLTTLALLATLSAPIRSGLKVGALVPSFEPTHVSGPDAGTKTCPVCKYGDLPAVQIWVNGESDDEVRMFAQAVDGWVSQSTHQLKGFVVLMTEPDCKDCKTCPKCKVSACCPTSVMAAFGNDFKNAAVAYIPSNDLGVEACEINVKPEVKNTIFVYKRMKVVKKFVNLKPDSAGLKALGKAIALVDR